MDVVMLTMNDLLHTVTKWYSGEPFYVNLYNVIRENGVFTETGFTCPSERLPYKYRVNERLYSKREYNEDVDKDSRDEICKDVFGTGLDNNYIEYSDYDDMYYSVSHASEMFETMWIMNEEFSGEQLELLKTVAVALEVQEYIQYAISELDLFF